MLFMSIAVTSLLAILGQGSILPRGRVFGGGTIVSPTSGSDAVAGQSIPFQYLDENGADACWSGYTTITVYLLAEPPSADDVSSSGTFTNFLYSFGNYTIPNFGLPPLPDFPPPPSTLTVPDLGPSVSDGELYFSVIEHLSECPPEGHTEIGLSFTPVEYSASS